MRRLVCLTVVMDALGVGLADAQFRPRPLPPPAPRPMPMPTPMPRMEPLPAPTTPQVEPLRPAERVEPAPPAASACYPHWVLARRDCSLVEDALYGASLDYVQNRLRRWAEYPDESPDPPCVRSQRVRRTC